MGKAYSLEYREEALKLMSEIGRGAASKKLGICASSLDNWKSSAEKSKKWESISELETVREMQLKIKEMEKEMSRLKKENEFLEEATRFFAAHRQK
jgi:transposase